VVFIPHQHAAAVLDAARKIDAGDSKRKQDIAAGADISVLVQKNTSTGLPLGLKS